MRSGRSRGRLVSPRRLYNSGDLVVVKVKGFPAWPATVKRDSALQNFISKYEEREHRGLRKVLVQFYGTHEIRFCPPREVCPYSQKDRILFESKTGKKNLPCALRDAIREIFEVEDYRKSTAAAWVGGPAIANKPQVPHDQEASQTETFQHVSASVHDEELPSIANSQNHQEETCDLPPNAEGRDEDFGQNLCTEGREPANLE